MTIEQIRSRIERIKDVSGDDEVAHSEEDDLMRDFIRYVSESATKDLAEKATLVLQTEDIDFNRWCA